MNEIIRHKLGLVNHIKEMFGVKQEVTPIKKGEDSGDNETGEGEHWITINHRHLLINGEGDVKMGGGGMAGGENLTHIGGGGGDKDDPDEAIHTQGAKISSHAGIGEEEYNKLHPGTKKELFNNMNRKNSDPVKYKVGFSGERGKGTHVFTHDGDDENGDPIFRLRSGHPGGGKGSKVAKGHPKHELFSKVMNKYTDKGVSGGKGAGKGSNKISDMDDEGLVAKYAGLDDEDRREPKYAAELVRRGLFNEETGEFTNKDHEKIAESVQSGTYNKKGVNPDVDEKGQLRKNEEIPVGKEGESDAEDFENTYSKEQADVYAGGGDPKTKEEELGKVDTVENTKKGTAHVKRSQSDIPSVQEIKQSGSKPVTFKKDGNEYSVGRLSYGGETSYMVKNKEGGKTKEFVNHQELVNWIKGNDKGSGLDDNGYKKKK